jgi:hypothetical protein
VSSDKKLTEKKQRRENKGYVKELAQIIYSFVMDMRSAKEEKQIDRI